MFDVPSDPTIAEIYIEEETITQSKPPVVVRRAAHEIA